jgi:hypothetical protein
VKHHCEIGQNRAIERQLKDFFLGAPRKRTQKVLVGPACQNARSLLILYEKIDYQGMISNFLFGCPEFVLNSSL